MQFNGGNGSRGRRSLGEFSRHAFELAKTKRSFLMLVGGLGALRLAHATGGVALVAIVARAWSLTDAGLFFMFVTVSAVGGALLMGPLQYLGLRHGAISRDRGDEKERLRLFSCGWLVVALLYIGLKGLLILVALVPLRWPPVVEALLATNLMAETIALTGLTSFMVGFARAEGWLRAAQFPDFIFRTWGFVLAALTTIWIPGAKASFTLPLLFVLIQIAGIVFLMAITRSHRLLFVPQLRRFRPRRAWVHEYPRLAMYVGTAALLVNVDLLFVGVLLSIEAAAVYKVAAQAAAIISSGIQLTTIVFSPRMAVLFKNGDMAGLQRVTRRSAQLSFILSALCVIIFAFGEGVLERMFGPAFASAFVPLMILAVGRLIGAWYGSATGLVVMTGNSTLVIRAQVVALLLSAAMILILTPLMAETGVAIAAAISVGVWNVLLARSVERKLGIKLGAMG